MNKFACHLIVPLLISPSINLFTTSCLTLFHGDLILRDLDHLQHEEFPQHIAILCAKIITENIKQG